MDPNRVLRPTVELPPAEWLTEDPDWFTPTAGRTVKIQLDPDHPEAGRAVGYVTPPNGTRCYMNPSASGDGGAVICRPTPGRSPDGYRTFHADMETFVDRDGTEHLLGVGTIPLGGGHSNQQMIAASTPTEARDWLQRKNRWARLAGDVGLYGRIEFVEGKGHLFRGWVAPTLTTAEAQALSLTPMSGEWLPDPELENQLVFAGPTRVDRTALAMQPLAAELDMTDDCDCPLGLVVSYLEDTGEEPMTTTEPETEPIHATAEDEIAELRTTVSNLQVQVDSLVEDVGTLAAMAVEDEAARGDGPSLSLQGLLERIISLEELSKEARDAVEQRDREIASLEERLREQDRANAEQSAVAIG